MKRIEIRKHNVLCFLIENLDFNHPSVLNVVVAIKNSSQWATKAIFQGSPYKKNGQISNLGLTFTHNI